MKIPALLLVGSIAANAACAVFYFSHRAPVPIATDPAHEAVLAAQRSTAQLKIQAATAATAQAQLWSALDSDDLKTLVARLHQAGFPRPVIRALVTARVQARFASRLDALARSAADTPYWKPTSTFSSSLNAKLEAERSQILRERGALLRETLGEMRELEGIGERVTTAQRRQFGDLSKTEIELLQRINDDYAEMTERARAATQGITLPEDRDRLALLEREKRVDLAAVLTPQELEEYELHSSPLTARLSSALTVMDASEAEFRTLFRIQQQFEPILNPPAGAIMPNGAFNQRVAAVQQMTDQIKAALGDARSAEFTRASDPEYQQLATLAQRENLPIAAAVQAFDLRAATSESSLRISNNSKLNYDQKLAALKTLADSTRAQLNTALGVAAGSSYAKSAMWLSQLDQGVIVSPSVGGFMSIRTLERPTPPAPKPPGN